MMDLLLALIVSAAWTAGAAGFGWRLGRAAGYEAGVRDAGALAYPSLKKPE